jgi:hypothetical protein
MPIDKNHNISDFYDNDIEADEIRTIKTAIEQAADAIEAGPVTHAQDATLYTIKALCSHLDAVADIIEEIGKRDGNE